MPKKNKKNKTYDEKFEELFDFNTGGEYADKKKEHDTPDTETEPEQVTDTVTEDNPLLVKEEENCTERFELKLKPSQMEALETLSDKYNKSKAEIMRTFFDLGLQKIKNNK